MHNLSSRKTFVSAICKKDVLAIGVVCISVLLAGCQRPDEDHAEFFNLNHEDRHPIQVKENMKEVALHISEDSGLADREKHRLRKFLFDYRKQGSEGIQVFVPNNAANKVAVKRAIASVKGVARNTGVAKGYLSFRTYDASYSDSVVRLKYSYATASTPKCGDYTQNLAINDSNLHYYNYGCATQKNIAAMIANPRDLQAPRGVDPNGRSGGRRDVIWDKYIKGETTVSQRSSDEKGTVSEVAKQ